MEDLMNKQSLFLINLLDDEPNIFFKETKNEKTIYDLSLSVRKRPITDFD